MNGRIQWVKGLPALKFIPTFIFRYECSATEYKSAVEDVSKGTEKGHQEEKKTSESPTPGTVTTFLVDEVGFFNNF